METKRRSVVIPINPYQVAGLSIDGTGVSPPTSPRALLLRRFGLQGGLSQGLSRSSSFSDIKEVNSQVESSVKSSVVDRTNYIYIPTENSSSKSVRLSSSKLRQTRAHQTLQPAKIVKTNRTILIPSQWNTPSSNPYQQFVQRNDVTKPHARSDAFPASGRSALTGFTPAQTSLSKEYSSRKPQFLAIVSNRGMATPGSIESDTPISPYRLSRRPSTSSLVSHPSTSSGVYICTSNAGTPTARQLLPRRDSISRSIASSNSHTSFPNNVALRKSTLLLQKNVQHKNMSTNPVEQLARPSTTQVLQNYNQAKGRLLIRIYIERVEPENTQAKRLQLQRTLLRHESSIVSRLSHTAHLSQIQIHHKWTGVITIIMSYTNPGEIAQLIAKEKDHDGLLKSALRRILADKSILADAGAAEIHLRMELFHDTRTQTTNNAPQTNNQGNIVRIHSQQLIAGRRDEPTATVPTPKPSELTATEKVLRTLKPIKFKIQDELKQICREYTLFQRNIMEFISVLKAAKPLDMQSISTQGDLLHCYLNLKNTSSSQRSVNAERLLEYLSLMDSLAEFCDEIHKDFLNLQSDAHTEGIGEKELLLPLAEKLNSMLEPTYKFSYHEGTKNIVLSEEDNVQFSGLLAFVPEVINHLDELLQIISIQIDTRQRQLLDADNDHI